MSSRPNENRKNRQLECDRSRVASCTFLKQILGKSFNRPQGNEQTATANPPYPGERESARFSSYVPPGLPGEITDYQLSRKSQAKTQSLTRGNEDRADGRKA